MKKLILTVLLGCIFILGVQAQRLLPNVTVRNLSGKNVMASTFNNDGKPIVISFWATWCKPCLSELSAFNDEYEDWFEETGLKIIAISIDDSRSSSRVKSLVSGNDWPFEVYLDSNQDLKRALNIINVPYTIILNGKGEIIWEHTGYNPGSEDEVIEKVLQLIK